MSYKIYYKPYLALFPPQSRIKYKKILELYILRFCHDAQMLMLSGKSLTRPYDGYSKSKYNVAKKVKRFSVKFM